ncbi:MAG: hypothetical protein IJA53_02155 [Spirochaetaceae bacterium]|nr:hypothetical protein [Spirochaetaceae bacterium]
MKTKQINLIGIICFIISLFACSSSMEIIVEDSEHIFSKEDISMIEKLNTTQYKFVIRVSNNYSQDTDFITMSNDYIFENNLKDKNPIIYYIGMKNRISSIQATNFVSEQISQDDFDKAMSIMIKNFKNDLYVLGITESIKYLDSVNDDIEL